MDISIWTSTCASIYIWALAIWDTYSKESLFIYLRFLFYFFTINSVLSLILFYSDNRCRLLYFIILNEIYCFPFTWFIADEVNKLVYPCPIIFLRYRDGWLIIRFWRDILLFPLFIFVFLLLFFFWLLLKQIV